MAEVAVESVRRLRGLTGAGMMDCKRALEESGGDIEKAVLLLRERGIAKAGNRAARATGQGVIEAYTHATGDYPPQIGAMVEVNCESDFVAKGDDFRHLARELAMHVAASAPSWVSRDEVPPDVLEREREVYRRRAEQEGKPPAAIDKIVDGRLEAFFKESCLVDQPYIRDPKTPVKDLIAEHISRLQENITVRRFARFSIREG
ncbi:MAG: translation elongation factor Ts [Candidatus Dormibacteraceae bacterium]